MFPFFLVQRAAIFQLHFAVLSGRYLRLRSFRKLINPLAVQSRHFYEKVKSVRGLKIFVSTRRSASKICSRFDLYSVRTGMKELAIEPRIL